MKKGAFLLGVDLRCLPTDGSPGRGIEHAARELWSALCEASGDHGVECVGFIPGGSTIDHVSSVIRLSGRRGSHLRHVLARHAVTALLVPSGAVPFGISVPCYPWVHDGAIFEHPEWFPQSWLKRQLTTHLFLRGLRSAPHIFAVSQCAGREIEVLLPSSRGRITVTGQGIASSPFKNGDRPVTSSYALVLGSTERRKNVDFIISWWSALQQRLAPETLSLVIAGPHGWDEDQRKVHHPSIIRLAMVTDHERDNLLCHATMILIPSLHEGFSRVALEGMSWGIPVLTSDRGALPEVVGDGGMVIPLNPEAWMSAIEMVVRDSDVREALKRRALERSKVFSWTKTAQIMLAKISSP